MDLKIEPGEGCLFATISGYHSLSEALELFQRAVEVAAERGLGTILVDCSAVEGDLPLLQRYELGKGMAEFGLSRSIAPKVAVIGVRPTITGFAAKVAWNRGLAVEVFSERQAGLNWLNAFGSGAAMS